MFFSSKLDGTQFQQYFKVTTPIGSLKKNPKKRNQPFVLVATEGVQLWHLPGHVIPRYRGGYPKSWMVYLPSGKLVWKMTIFKM